MSWNYRVMRHEQSVEARTLRSDPAEVWFEIHEVYYDRDTRKPTSCTTNAVVPYGSTPEELASCLEMMAQALKEPVLDYDTFLRDIASEDTEADVALATDDTDADDTDDTDCERD